MSKQKSRIGERNYFPKSGMNGEVVASYKDPESGALRVDVRFDNGEIVRGRVYDCFRKGTILVPGRHVGKRYLQGSGLTVTITGITNEAKGFHWGVNVLFPDGKEKRGVGFDDVRKGIVRHPDDTELGIHPVNFALLVHALKPFGFARARIAGTPIDLYNDDLKLGIEYVDSARFPRKVLAKRHRLFSENNVDVIAVRDGVLVPEDELCLKTVVLENGGHVQFSDEAMKGLNEVVALINERYGLDVPFIKKPTLEEAEEILSEVRKRSRVGEVVMMKNLKKAKLTKVHPDGLVDVEFEDGAVVERRLYTNFRSGEIAHPEHHAASLKWVKKHMGETLTDKHGKTIKIIEGTTGGRKVTFLFPDGSIRKDCDYFGYKRTYSKSSLDKKRSGKGK